MQAIGLCRFSYPALGGFQVEHDDIGDRIAYLYAPDRLEERFRLFETVSLPALRAQTDADFDLVVLIGDSLPRAHHDRLRDITANVPQVRIVAEPPRPHREVMKEVLNRARRDPKAPCLQFRHDDDDAVAVDFIARLRGAAADCAGLCRANRSVAFDFSRGFLARFDAAGIHAADHVHPLFVAGLGMHVPGGSHRTIMNFAHAKLGRFMPVVSFCDTPMFVRGHNAYNDSRQKPVRNAALAPLDATGAALFRDRFAIDIAAVRRAFSAA